jgi:hypothetical protein
MSTKLFNYINIIKTYIIKDYLMGILSAIILENEGFSLNDMTLLQRLMLKKVYIGKLNYDHISDKETKILDELVDFGLLDIGYEITPDGEHAAKLLDKYSKEEREDLSIAKQIAAAETDVYDKENIDNDYDDYTFTENEKIIMQAAGLNPIKIAKILKEAKEKKP